MRVIIAGSRNITSFHTVAQALQESGFDVSEVLSGGARGVDRLGEVWAKKYNLPIRQFLADWDKYGKSAGYRRNAEMALYADALVAIWDGCSRGTKHMIDLAHENGLQVYVKETGC